jgi:DnaK suppressor protein
MAKTLVKTKAKKKPVLKSKPAKSTVSAKAKPSAKAKAVAKKPVAKPKPKTAVIQAVPKAARFTQSMVKAVKDKDNSANQVVVKKELPRFEKMLLDERARLLGSIRNIEEASRSEAGRDYSGDLSSYAETGTDNFELETALNIASGESEWIRNISDALRRIQEGVFGVCEMCEQPIAKKRLEAFPSARYCIKCQAETEKRRTNNGMNNSSYH